MNKLTRHLCWHQNFVPWGLSAPANENILYKIDFKEIFWNLQYNTEVTRCSCWHQNFVPKGLSDPALGLYTCIKSWKKCIKSYKEVFFEPCSKKPKWLEVSVDIKILYLGCLPLICGCTHLLNHAKKCIKSEVKEILFKLAANDHSDEAFLLT